MKTNKKLLLSSKQAAEQLRVTRQTLSRYDLPKKIRIGGKTYYQWQEIEKIKMYGLDVYLEQLKKQFDGCGEIKDGEDEWQIMTQLVGDFGDRLRELIGGQRWQTFMRYAFLSHPLYELTEFIDETAEYTCVFETVEKDENGKNYTDLDFYPASKNYAASMLELIKTANDPQTPISRYNILPTEIFKALYHEHLFYLFFAQALSDVDYAKKTNDILDYMLPFKAEKGKEIMANAIGLEASEIEKKA